MMNEEALKKALEKTEGFRFEAGEYVECDSIRTREEDGNIILFHKQVVIDYSRIAREMTEGLYIPLFINKNQLKLHLNDLMIRRELYNIESNENWETDAPDLTRDKENAVEMWKNYQYKLEDRQVDYEDYLKAYNEKMDMVEKMVHMSLFSNEERWFMGRMSTENYLKESIWRESVPLEKAKKMQNELEQIRLHLIAETNKLRERQMEIRRKAVCERKMIRVFPIGHVIYWQDELIAIFLNDFETTVIEYDCVPEMEIRELTGRCYGMRTLYNKKPMLVPLVQHLMEVYRDKLPEKKI